MRTSTPLVLWLLLVAPLPAAAETIALANGDRLTGEVVERTDTVVVFVHPQLGRLELAPSQLLAFSSPEEARQPSLPTGTGGALPGPPRPEQAPGREGEGEAQHPAEEEPWWSPKAGGLFGTPLLRGWDSRLGLGLSGSYGGFEDTKLSVLFRTGTRDERRRWLFDSSYFLNVTPPRDQQEKTVSKNQALVLLRRDALALLEDRPKLFLFTQSRYQFDEFQPWRHRASAHLGPGYPVVDREALKLILRLGVGGSYAWGEVRRAQPEGLAAFDVEWQLNHWNAVSWKNEFILDFADTETTRTIQSIDWSIDLSEGAGLGFKLGLIYTYDTQSEGKANDLTYLGSLTYDF